ncbi:hypothetical protein EXIGLDRAFT_847916, partial [Exidia glandulosa HHB12029]
MVLRVLAALVLAATASAAAIAERAQLDCFPFGTAKLPKLGHGAPKRTREEWWCSAEHQYGFMGFSYPLEDDDCSGPSNSFAQINADFKRMKKEFGSTMVRIYAPQCRDATIWKTLIQAGIANNMAVIPQIWWGFENNQDLWMLSRTAFFSVLNDPLYGPIAPYVFHSLAFGSEPIGDFVDGGYDGFIADLNITRQMLQPYGIPISMSEDWDRAGILASDDRTSLGPVGIKIAPLMDNLQLHPMPYYHANIYPSADTTWPYFEWYMDFIARNLPGKPILITETQWASFEGGAHDRGWGNPGED